MTDPIAAAIAAHKAALAAREAMDAAAKERGAAIRAAFAAGYTAPQLGRSVGCQARAAYLRNVETMKERAMTPTEAEHLRDLFYEARHTARDVLNGRPESVAADDAATAAFNTALRECTK